ncbi:hypothetical protein, partial [Paraburkholderia sp.]|uniref:hypothetical protein n=1 Tax=Paraburkholderia sp. TaxID=1926495 RepID=UPI002F4224D3
AGFMAVRYVFRPRAATDVVAHCIADGARVGEYGTLCCVAACVERPRQKSFFIDFKTLNR